MYTPDEIANMSPEQLRALYDAGPVSYTTWGQPIVLASEPDENGQVYGVTLSVGYGTFSSDQIAAPEAEPK
jgi:hypothetical protein